MPRLSEVPAFSIVPETSHAYVGGYLAGVTGIRSHVCPFDAKSKTSLYFAWLDGWKRGNRSWKG